MSLDELISEVAKLQYEWAYFNRNSRVDFVVAKEITKALAMVRGLIEGFKTHGYIKDSGD